MAVPLYKRSVSKKQYFYHYKKTQKEIISLLLRDFGIKEQKDDVIECPMWLIEFKRTEILRSLTVISTYISRAGAIYPDTEELKQNRLTYQMRAIQECFALHDNIQFCSEILPVKNRNVYTQIAHDIQQEVTFLRYWKRVTNKIKIKDTVEES